VIRSLWLILVTIAIANTLGFLIFASFLAATDRLSEDRLVALREIFSDTVTAQRIADERADREREQEEADAEEEAKVGTPPITARARSQYMEEIARSAEQRAIRTSREARDRQETLFEWQRDLEKREAAFQEELEAFEERRREIAEREGSEQFAKALKVYESMPPDQAAEVFRELVRDGRDDEVVSFLNAMKPRIAAEVTGEILGEDAGMAAMLLERLREHGVPDGTAPEEPA